MNAIDLLAEVIREHSPKDIWTDSPVSGYRRLGNTNRGEVTVRRPGDITG